jgi:hypothetical protein
VNVWADDLAGQQGVTAQLNEKFDIRIGDVLWIGGRHEALEVLVSKKPEIAELMQYAGRMD